MNLIQAFVWNVGTCHLMLRKKLECIPHKSLSTDAGDGGGTVRSSDEASVMEVEQRGCTV
jgi:hypothetical protein